MQQTYPAARNTFLFGEPSGFFDPFEQIESIDTPLRDPLLAFKTNLSSAFQVGNIPFKITQAAVIGQRYNQLCIAEKIRSGADPEDEEADKIARKTASTRLQNELKDKETIDRFSEETLWRLDDHLNDEEFIGSAHELLRQVLVICWGAFEIVVNDTLKVLLNARPHLIRAFQNNKPYRELLSGEILLDALAANEFNISTTMGDIFCEVVRLDSLEKIREAVHLCIAEPAVDTILKDERLWRISQQRHLIVRGFDRAARPRKETYSP